MCSFIHWRLNKELSNTDWFLPKQILDPETVRQLRDHVRVYIDFTGGEFFRCVFCSGHFTSELPKTSVGRFSFLSLNTCATVDFIIHYEILWFI